MKPSEIAEAKARAADVVNGFKRVTDRNARDALRLADALEQAIAEIAALYAANDSTNEVLKKAKTVEELFSALGIKGARNV